jgi:hypothetical protein
MRRAAIIMLGACLISVSPVMAQGLPDGTFASTADGCTKLKDKTPAELGDDLDFYVLNKKGVVAHLQTCDFLQVTAHDPKSWIATAFCQESGYVYPDLFAIAQKDDGGLAVTRLTDLTQQEEDDEDQDSQPPSSDMNPVELDHDHTDDNPSADENQGGAAQARPAGFNDYVLCTDAKQQ